MHAQATEPARVAPTIEAIELSSLGLRRGDRFVLRDLDLTIEAGSFVLVTGPSGVGKSTLLAALAGMLDPAEGTVRYRTRKGLLPPSAVRGSIGIAFQGNLLVDRASLLDNVAAGRLGRYSTLRTLWDLPRRDRDEAARLLQSLGLGENVGRWVVEVSGGEAQRTALARALFVGAPVVLADEPASNLDPKNAERVMHMLADEATDHGRIVVCVTHDPSTARTRATHTLRFEGDGESVAEVTLREVGEEGAS